tara:strand:+ start:186 stop:746 length:561 start_codon:yes stop_codon:yes gene_type:complete
MRIIAGKFRGKKIKFINSLITRPLRDIVRENIFNLINHSNNINIKLDKSNVLDLYAGIGSFGIECISRNVKKVVFVERNEIAYSILKENISSLKLKDYTKLISSDVSFFLKNNKDSLKFDIIFFDPPYNDSTYINYIKIIKSLDIIKQKHLIIIHRDKQTKEDLKDILNILFVKKYGRSKVIFGYF